MVFYTILNHDPIAQKSTSETRNTFNLQQNATSGANPNPCSGTSHRRGATTPWPMGVGNVVQPGWSTDVSWKRNEHFEK